MILDSREAVFSFFFSFVGGALEKTDKVVLFRKDVYKKFEY